MSTPRMKNVQKLETNQRKFVCIMNDVARMQQTKYDGAIDREKQESSQISEKKISKTRKNLVRRKVLKKCMQSKREEVEKQQANKIFGRYQGETAENISSEIDSYIQSHHPKLRRKQKIEALFKSANKNGVILDNETMKDKVETYFTRPLIRIQHFGVKGSPERATATSSLPTVTKSFYTGQAEKHYSDTHDFHKERYEAIDEIPEHEGWTTEESDDNETPEKMFVRRKTYHFVTEEVRDTLSVQSDAPKTLTIPVQRKEIRPLTLPTKKPERDVAMPITITHSAKPKADCITELIDRMHRAKDTKDRDTRVRKEKRARRLQADRLKAVGSKDSRQDPKGNNWDAYEARRNELLTSISHTKRAIGMEPADETKNGAIGDKGRLRLPPISVTQGAAITKLSS